MSWQEGNAAMGAALSEKLFIGAEELLRDSFQLALDILESG
ncbi:MAG: hypothetical protein AAF679_09805 [Pseudomonadota bacterium]